MMYEMGGLCQMEEGGKEVANTRHANPYMRRQRLQQKQQRCGVGKRQ